MSEKAGQHRLTVGILPPDEMTETELRALLPKIESAIGAVIGNWTMLFGTTLEKLPGQPKP